MTTLKQRFMAKVEQPANGAACWLWTAYRSPANGYAMIAVGARPQRAHRVSWELFRGPIPRGSGFHGTCVLHRCDNRRCVNPDHLFLGSQSDNNKDCATKGRHRSPNRAKTECPHGHAYTSENTRILANGWRVCKSCEHNRKVAYYARNTERVKEAVRSYRQRQSQPTNQGILH